MNLDISAQLNVPYNMKTAYGYTPTFVITGVTKQGGPLSPLKSTLTTSLGNLWLHNLVFEFLDPPLTVSTLHHKLQDFHTPTDLLLLHPTMVEAMDDSLLFACTFLHLNQLCFQQESFQASYGWETNWEKSSLYVLNADPPSTSVQIDTVDPQHPGDPLYRHQALVPIETSHIHFLKTRIGDPKHTFLFLKSLINSFQFPYTQHQLPLTIIRCIIKQ
ncbi:hypothetical protein AMATHDRAFT_51507 [Amanita thiersii Skay4041]|uniref:Reverse transcriptase domain-containing protein n=1 Tax=Amanita thiersii Skay4041 TaxID=703135 RepID=A0A2A9N7X2_9AGAR|nr:hypothetical protein AMATHDRAFT_51507 [Amanita thiersii Skay4041]